MKDIDKMSSNELRAEVRVLRAVYEAASQINRENTYLTIGPDMSDLNTAIAAVEAQE